MTWNTWTPDSISELNWQRQEREADRQQQQREAAERKGDHAPINEEPQKQ